MLLPLVRNYGVLTEWMKCCLLNLLKKKNLQSILRHFKPFFSNLTNVRLLSLSQILRTFQNRLPLCKTPNSFRHSLHGLPQIFTIFLVCLYFFRCVVIAGRFSGSGVIVTSGSGPITDRHCFSPNCSWFIYLNPVAIM